MALLHADTDAGRRALARIEAALGGSPSPPPLVAEPLPAEDPVARVLWLLWRCQTMGIRLWRDGDRLRAQPAPPADVLAELKMHRALVVVALTADEDNDELGITDADVRAGTRRWCMDMTFPDRFERWREAALAEYRRESDDAT